MEEQFDVKGVPHVSNSRQSLGEHRSDWRVLWRGRHTADDQAFEYALPPSEASSGLHLEDAQVDEYLSHYAPIDTYEGKHRYDPKAQWSLEEEKRLVRKVYI